jgi:hypothetical protein
MLLSPESVSVVGAFVVNGARAAQAFRNIGLDADRPGSENMCKRELGVPRNLGDSAVSTKNSRTGIPGDQPQARRQHSHPFGR